MTLEPGGNVTPNRLPAEAAGIVAASECVGRANTFLACRKAKAPRATNAEK